METDGLVLLRQRSDSLHIGMQSIECYNILNGYHDILQTGVGHLNGQRGDVAIDAERFVDWSNVGNSLHNARRRHLHQHLLAHLNTEVSRQSSTPAFTFRYPKTV